MHREKDEVCVCLFPIIPPAGAKTGPAFYRSMKKCFFDICCTSYITALGTYSQCFAILGTNDVENKMTKPVKLTDISSKISFLERTNNSSITSGDILH